MKLHYIIFAALLPASLHSFAQGLKFSGSEYPIAERTSYDVFAEKTVVFSERFEIKFRLLLYPKTQIGYILRLTEERSDAVYNLFYDGQGLDHLFMLNREGRSCVIRAEIPRSKLPVEQWFDMHLRFDLAADSIRMSVNGHMLAIGGAGLPATWRPAVNFGKSDHIIDVPSFAIKELAVWNNDRRYLFPLRESEGNIVYDEKGYAMGRVSKPEWLINMAYRWRFLTSFRSKSVAGANYDCRRKKFYYFNRDSITTYDMQSGQIHKSSFDRACPVPLKLGTNFIDTLHGRLYAYEVWLETPDEEITVASLDLDSLTWRAEGSNRLPTQLHHHGCCFDASSDRYIIFGGFGNMHYNGSMYSLDVRNIAKNGWKRMDDLEGDVICPRYFQSVGYHAKTGSIYIFGGMGNDSGEQVVGRRYLYDLYRIDLDTRRVTLLWKIPWMNGNVVPVREMVISDEDSFYTLCYPEHVSDSFLKLYRFSLKDGSYTILGDSIPIRSDKITTNANLYYDDQLNTLLAVVQEFDTNDIASSLKIYSLAFPPVSNEELSGYVKNRRYGMTISVIIISCTALGWFLFVRRRRAAKMAGKATAIPSAEMTQPNSICIFGDFTARNKHGGDISHLFSTRLRQAFCLILQYSVKEGLASRRMGDMLWPDKSKESIKNSMGVTINHLRKALSEFEGIELINDKGRFRIVQHEQFYCDHTRMMQIIASGKWKESRAELLSILSRGKFLGFSDHSLLDSFKEETERNLEPALLQQMKDCFATADYRATIGFAEAIFRIDPLNDEALNFLTKALHKLNLREEANLRQQAFATEYLKVMGRNHPAL